MSEGRRAWILLLLFAVGGSLTLFVGCRWLLPLAQAIPAWLVLVDALRRGRPWRGVALMLFWAACASVVTIELSLYAPAAAEKAILRGATYREEMFTWIRTGVGTEGDFTRFFPEHMQHYGLTLGLSFASAGLLGLSLGAVLLNYMNFYVAELVRASASPTLASLIGWPIWSCLRVIGFVLGAIAAAHFPLGRLLRRAPWDRRTALMMLGASLAFVAADLAVKALLGPFWRQWLLGALGR
jgi:hypothetical protein